MAVRIVDLAANLAAHRRLHPCAQPLVERTLVGALARDFRVAAVGKLPHTVYTLCHQVSTSRVISYSFLNSDNWCSIWTR